MTVMKQRMKIYISLLLILALSLPAMGQEFSPIVDVNKLADYQAVLKQVHPNWYADIGLDSVYKTDPDHAVIAYSAKDKHYQTIVNDGRKEFLVIATYELVPRSSVPDIVLDAFTLNNKEWIIESTQKVTEPYGESYYCVRAKKGDVIKEFFYDNSGQFKKPPL